MNSLIQLSCLIGFACAMVPLVFAGEQKVRLMLGGKFHEAYPGDVEAALAKHSGVKAVGLKNMKGHVVVTRDGEKVKANQLAAPVNGLRVTAGIVLEGGDEVDALQRGSTKAEIIALTKIHR